MKKVLLAIILPVFMILIHVGTLMGGERYTDAYIKNLSPVIREPVELTINGGGGFIFSALLADLNFLENEISGMGIDPFGSGALFLFGGSGSAEVFRNVRLGAAGGGGSKSTSGVSSGLSRRAEISIGFGGATAEYYYLLGRRMEISAGLLLGLGTIKITLTQSGKEFMTWKELWSDFQGESISGNQLRAVIGGIFIAINPYFSIKYHIFEWMGLKLQAGYFRARVGSGKSVLNGDFKIGDAPGLSLSGPIINLTIYFGS
ncbi:MAG: hypothetical protein ACE5QV_00310 [Fidelibacterota bacterium]